MSATTRLGDFPASSERSLESVRALPEAQKLVPSKVLAKLRKCNRPAHVKSGLKPRRRTTSGAGFLPPPQGLKGRSGAKGHEAAAARPGEHARDHMAGDTEQGAMLAGAMPLPDWDF